MKKMKAMIFMLAVAAINSIHVTAYAGIGEVGGIGSVGSLNPNQASDELQDGNTGAPASAAPAPAAPENTRDPAPVDNANTASGPVAAKPLGGGNDTQPLSGGKAKALPPEPVHAGVPILSISYNQKKIYYERLLKQVIANAEQGGNGGTTYEVVSLVPAKVMQIREGAKYLTLFKQNADSIASQILALGVDAGRIRKSQYYHEGIPTQQVDIYASQPK